MRIATDQEATEAWWELQRADFEIFISQVVVREVRRGDAELAAARLAKIREFNVLEPTPESEELTVRLLADGIVPAVAADDAAHIRRIERACAVCGLFCPVIATPNELMNLQP